MNIRLVVSFRPLLFFSILVFMVVEFSDWILPFNAKGLTSSSSAKYYFAFLVIFVFFILLSIPKVYANIKLGPTDRLQKLLSWFSLISFLSLVAVFYDRFFIQDVSYSEGIAQARESWREMATSREGVSSIINVLGNFFFPLSFFVFALSYSFYENISRPKCFLYGSVLIIFLFSVLTGGRELLLILCSVAVASICLRKGACIPIIPKKVRFDVIIFLSVVFGFSIYIGYARSQTYSDGLAWYSGSLAVRLGGIKASETIDEPSVLSVVMPVLIYIAHVKWVFINVIDAGMGEGLSTFRQIFSMLDRYTPLTDELVKFEAPIYSPNWISSIGSFYYDFGYYGLIGGGIFFSLLWFSALVFLKVYELSRCFFSIFYFYTVCAVTVMFPFTLMFEIVHFVYLFIPLFFTLIWSFFVSIQRRSDDVFKLD